jgi:peptidoglycan/xylan/chitin deacetylase (PgdA/CDA1 family)
MMQPLVPRESRGVAILTYHLVGAGTSSPVDLPVDVFRSQLRELSQFARVLSLTDALNHLDAAVESTRPVVVVTFDDGFDNFRTGAWPHLREFEIPSTLYVPVGFIEGATGSPLARAEHLGPLAKAHLRELASEPLMTIGSHSWCHGDMRALSVDELRGDLRRSRARLEDCTGTSIVHFCYPRAKWSRAVEKEVGATYRTAVIAGGRRNFAESFHPLRLGRIPVRTDMPTRLAPVVDSTIWLEEWAASYARTIPWPASRR